MSRVPQVRVLRKLPDLMLLRKTTPPGLISVVPPAATHPIRGTIARPGIIRGVDAAATVRFASSATIATTPAELATCAAARLDPIAIAGKRRKVLPA
jgi:hypothetical protein